MIFIAHVTPKVVTGVTHTCSLVPRLSCRPGNEAITHVELHMNTLNQDGCRSSYTLNKVKISLSADSSTGMFCIQRCMSGNTYTLKVHASLIPVEVEKLGNKVSPICTPQCLVSLLNIL